MVQLLILASVMDRHVDTCLTAKTRVPQCQALLWSEASGWWLAGMDRVTNRLSALIFVKLRSRSSISQNLKLVIHDFWKKEEKGVVSNYWLTTWFYDLHLFLYSRLFWSNIITGQTMPCLAHLPKSAQFYLSDVNYFYQQIDTLLLAKLKIIFAKKLYHLLKVA